jgi:hypothetical protein
MYRHRQLHLWISEHDYAALRAVASARGETLSSVIRHLIKSCEGCAAGEIPALAPAEPRGLGVATALPD